MNKAFYILLILFFAINGFSQTIPVPGTTPLITPQNERAAFKKNLQIPYGVDTSLNGGLDSTANIFLQLKDTSLYIRVNTLSTKKWVKINSGSGDTVINNIYYGSLFGLRVLNNPSVKTAYVGDFGTGIFAQDEADMVTPDNTWETIVSASGKRYKRQWDGIQLQVEWFGVKGDGITDNTDSLQKAVNTAYKKILVFNKDAVYKWQRVYLPSGITLVGNGCKIAAIDGSRTGGLFNITAYRNSLSTGIYAGGAGQPVYKPSIRNVENIDISGFVADLNGSLSSFFSAEGSFASNTVFKNINIHDNVIRNFSTNAIWFSSELRPSDSTAIFRNIVVKNNNISYNGLYSGLALSTNGVVGDTSIVIHTIDKGIIEPRLRNYIGSHFWIGSPITSVDTLDNMGYNTTNVYFRLKSYTVNINDSSEATIVFEGGSYDNTNGWIANTGNTGLKARVSVYNMIIPIDPQSGSLMFTLPDFSAVSGSTILTRTTSSITQDAYHRNLIVGMKFMTNDGYSGLYTVTGLTSSTITITPALSHAITGVRLLPLTSTVDCISVAANVQNVLVTNNYGYGANHFLNILQVAPLKKWADEGYCRYYVENNEWWYMWMGVESPNTMARVTSGYNPFSNISVNKGDTSFTPAIASRIGSKDMGSGPVKFLTASTTTDPNVANDNSYFVGDVLAWSGEHYRYIIKDIYLNAGTPTVSLRKFDTYTKQILDSGFSVSSSNLSVCYRLYTPQWGENGVAKYMLFNNNYGYYTMRNAGGSGYHISCAAYAMDIIGNHFYQSENSSIEVHASTLNISNNEFVNTVFDGNEAKPSLTKLNSTSGISYKGWGAIIGSNVTVSGNKFSGSQPDNPDYDFRTGNILLQPNVLCLNPMESFVFKGNILNGFMYQMFTTVEYNNIGGRNYPIFYYNLMDVEGNVISATKSFVNLGWANNLLSIGKSLVLQSNTLTVSKKVPDIKVFVTDDKPNPQLFDSTLAYSIRIENNYDTTGNLNSPYLLNHAGVFWNDNKATLDRSQTFTNKTLDNPSFNNLTGSGNALTFNTVTKKIERTNPLPAPFANNILIGGTGTGSDTLSMRTDRLKRWFRVGDISTTPGANFEYYGDSSVSISSYFKVIHPAKTGLRYAGFQATDGNGLSSYLGMDNGQGWVGTSSNTYFNFRTNNNVVGSLSPTGQWCIGCAFPTEQLSIGKPGNAANLGLFGNTSGKVNITVPSAITNYSLILPATSAGATVGQLLKITNISGTTLTLGIENDNTGGGSGSSLKGTIY